MDGLGIFFTILAAVAVVVVVLYFLGKRAQKKSDEAQAVINKNRQFVNAYIIDKKKAKITEANFPQAAVKEMPLRMKFLKVPLVKIKAGPQIMTMMAEPTVYKTLPVKKNVRLEISGAYILSYSTQKKGEKKVEFERKLTWREKLSNKMNDWQNARRDQQEADRQEAIAKEKARRAKEAAKKK